MCVFTLYSLMLSLSWHSTFIFSLSAPYFLSLFLLMPLLISAKYFILTSHSLSLFTLICARSFYLFSFSDVKMCTRNAIYNKFVAIFPIIRTAITTYIDRMSVRALLPPLLVLLLLLFTAQFLLDQWLYGSAKHFLLLSPYSLIANPIPSTTILRYLLIMSIDD